MYLYDTYSDSWTTLGGLLPNSPASTVNGSWDLSQGHYGNFIAGTSGSLTATGAFINESAVVGLKIKVVAGLGRGQERTIVASSQPENLEYLTPTATYTTNFPVDMTLVKSRNLTSEQEAWDRLRGSSKYLLTTAADAEATFGGPAQWQVDRMTSVLWNAGDGYSNTSPNTYGTWNFRRAPGFFDEVCYTGDGTTNRAVAHNLTVAPELIIVKARSAANYWWMVYAEPLGPGKYLALQATFASGTNSAFPLAQTATNFYVSATGADVNVSSVTFVAYLFATLAGVSKVGSYTGTGALQTIDCGFAAGARFVLIKRTDSTGDWYVWDSARGISSGNDPYLLLNSTAAEVTGTNYVDTTAVGFQVTAAAPAALNASGGTYIFLAIA